MSMKEKLAVTVLVTTLALFGLVVVLYRMIKDKTRTTPDRIEPAFLLRQPDDPVPPRRYRGQERNISGYQ